MESVLVKNIECRNCDGDGWLETKTSFSRWLFLLENSYKQQTCSVCKGIGFHQILVQNE